MAKKTLPLSGEGTSTLGQDTIMDRALAARHGAPYVHLAAFAIDVDRVFQADPADGALPFGWEVLLTEAYLLRALGPRVQPAAVSLLEDACLGILERPRGDAPLGGQLAFAVYSAARRGALPAQLQACFKTWRKPPAAFADELAALWAQGGLVPRLARHCLETPLSPGLVPPVVAALEGLCDAPAQG